MPAAWIIDQLRKQPRRRQEQERLELPLELPREPEEARSEDDEGDDPADPAEPERGFAVVDFYL